MLFCTVACWLDSTQIVVQIVVASISTSAPAHAHSVSPSGVSHLGPVVVQRTFPPEMQAALRNMAAPGATAASQRELRARLRGDEPLAMPAGPALVSHETVQTCSQACRHARIRAEACTHPCALHLAFTAVAACQQASCKATHAGGPVHSKQP